MTELNVLYRRIDELLELRARDFPRRVEPTWSRLRAALDEVTERLRAAAAAGGAPAPAVGEALLDSPIFVVGYPKSGTTLLLGLLDGHRELAVIPGETRYFTDLRSAARGSRERLLDDLHRRFVPYLINPTGQSPFWLLGRPWEEADGYARFSDRLHALASEHDREPLALLAAAFADGPARTWVEKTPLHLEHVDEILGVFPGARFIQVVRDPRSVSASIRHFREHGWSLDSREVVRGIDRALRAALERPARLGEDRYLVVRYEQLVAAPEPELRRIAAFAGVDWDDALLRPTLAGRPMRANSAWLDRRTIGEIHSRSLGEPHLQPRLLRTLLAETGESARALGYPLPARGLMRGLFGRRRESAGRAASPPPPGDS